MFFYSAKTNDSNMTINQETNDTLILMAATSLQENTDNIYIYKKYGTAVQH